MADKSPVLARPFIPRAATSIQDTQAAAQDFISQLDGPELGGVLFFADSNYDLEKLGPALHAAYSCPIIGCTSAEQIGLRFLENSLVGLGLPASLFKLHTTPPIPLAQVTDDWALQFREMIHKQLQISATNQANQFAGLVLYDGSADKAQLTALTQPFHEISLVCAGAGDKENGGLVYSAGTFSRGTAIFAFLESKLPFQSFAFSENTGTPLSTTVIQHEIHNLRKTISDPILTIGFESMQHRVSLETAEISQETARMLTSIHFLGFTASQVLHNNSSVDSLAGIAFGAG